MLHRTQEFKKELAIFNDSVDIMKNVGTLNLVHKDTQNKNLETQNFFLRLKYSHVSIYETTRQNEDRKNLLNN